MPRDPFWLEYHDMMDRLYDGGQLCLIQRNPSQLEGIPETTCRYSHCPLQDNVFQPDDFRASIEPHAQCFPNGQGNFLGFKAIKALSQVKQSSHTYQKSKRGLGRKHEQWRCLLCIEALLDEGRKRMAISENRSTEFSYPAILDYSEWIFSEQRHIPAYPDKFTLSAPLRHAIEKWKAVRRFLDHQSHPDDPQIDAPAHLESSLVRYPGHDGASLYMDKETRDLKGIMDDGQIAEISAQDCQNATLSSVLIEVATKMGTRQRAKTQLRMVADLAAKVGAIQIKGAISIKSALAYVHYHAKHPGIAASGPAAGAAVAKPLKFQPKKRRLANGGAATVPAVPTVQQDGPSGERNEQ